MRIVSQSGKYNLPYSLMSVSIHKTKIYAHMINGVEYVLGTYSTEEKSKYIFGQILCWGSNSCVGYFKLPEDGRVDLDNLD